MKTKMTNFPTMTALLREALAEAPSMLGVQKATGVKRQALTPALAVDAL